MSYQEKEHKKEKGTDDPFPNASKGTDFAGRLASLIPENGIRSVCRDTGISYGAMQKYLTGQSSPKLDNLVRLAEVLRVDINWLATGRGQCEGVAVESSANIGRTATPLALPFLSSVLGTLTPTEQADLAHMLARKGVEVALYLLDDGNIELLKLDQVIKNQILAKHFPTEDEQVQHNNQNANVCDVDSESEDRQTAVANERRAV